MCGLWRQSCRKRKRLVLFLPNDWRKRAHTHTQTHDRQSLSVGSDCVRMISTISANCDVAFCALTVIIADFTDLHTTLPFPTSLLLLTYSLFSLFIRGSPTAVYTIAYRRQGGKELQDHGWNSQSNNQSDNQSFQPPPPFTSLCVVWGPKWRLRFIFLSSSPSR